MRLSEDLRRCVVFLGWQEAGPIDEAPIDPKGTGFLMHGGRDTLGPGIFLVTAKHLTQSLAPPFVMRVNKKGGGADLVHFDRPQDVQWCFHPTDSTADVAVAPIELPSWVDAASYSALGVLETDPPEIAQIGPGDEAYVVGLFHFHAGRRSNLPIVHTGHIAMLPGDELILDGRELVEGYLVQANAISGCSGSPVFGTRTIKLTGQAGNGLAGSSTTANLIGVWSSSWKVENSKIVAVRTNDEDEKGVKAPLGMGIVTPASKIADILMSSELQFAREGLAQHRLRAQSATPDQQTIGLR